MSQRSRKTHSIGLVQRLNGLSKCMEKWKQVSCSRVTLPPA
jgi:hypothetical protein